MLPFCEPKRERREPGPEGGLLQLSGLRPCGLALAGGQRQGRGPGRECESLGKYFSSTSHVLGSSNWMG